MGKVLHFEWQLPVYRTNLTFCTFHGLLIFPSETTSVFHSVKLRHLFHCDFTLPTMSL
jgi:hypothetical protein